MPLTTIFDFEHRRAIIVEGYDPVFTFTTASDLATIVVKAVDHEGEWPEVGGISGNKVLASQVLEYGKKFRGKSDMQSLILTSTQTCIAGGAFAIDKVKVEDLEAGILKTSWMPTVGHISFDQEQAAKMIETAYIGILLSGTKGAWDVSEEHNQLFPDFKFTEIEKFLEEHWSGKP